MEAGTEEVMEGAIMGVGMVVEMAAAVMVVVVIRYGCYERAERDACIDRS